jgi:hypothetical protein
MHLRHFNDLGRLGALVVTLKNELMVFRKYGFILGRAIGSISPASAMWFMYCSAVEPNGDNNATSPRLRRWTDN